MRWWWRGAAKLYSKGVTYLTWGWVEVGSRGARGTLLTKERGYIMPHARKLHHYKVGSSKEYTQIQIMSLQGLGRV